MRHEDRELETQRNRKGLGHPDSSRKGMKIRMKYTAVSVTGSFQQRRHITTRTIIRDSIHHLNQNKIMFPSDQNLFALYSRLSPCSSILFSILICPVKLNSRNSTLSLFPSCTFLVVLSPRIISSLSRLIALS